MSRYDAGRTEIQTGEHAGRIEKRTGKHAGRTENRAGKHAGRIELRTGKHAGRIENGQRNMPDGQRIGQGDEVLPARLPHVLS